MIDLRQESTADLVLHPVRMRLIQLLSGNRLTPQEMVERLGDVPPATLYRHLAKLTAGGVVAVAEERPVRGAVEKVYTLPSAEVDVTRDLMGASREEQMRWFTTFVATLLGNYGRYLAQPSYDLAKDGVGYRQWAFFLSDAEYQAFLEGLRALIQKAMANHPAPDRHRRLITTMFMPDVPGPAREPDPES